MSFYDAPPACGGGRRFGVFGDPEANDGPSLLFPTYTGTAPVVERAGGGNSPRQGNKWATAAPLRSESRQIGPRMRNTRGSIFY
ncbi:hypothetical protein EVAR_19362_1 [Eumeta japonica]|uniref:Uncharacterized protein n=1 Tax=Eumeta variegata TaxID=151549 RepID=A0A4C1TRM8_EUMVA|nr:hypothetical protein EVAR_19362_1 [Eumeta japonica]